VNEFFLVNAVKLVDLSLVFKPPFILQLNTFGDN
jgi:hypothetical protein